MDKKLVVKLSHPLNWYNHGHWSYKNHFPHKQQEWGNYRFEINNDDVKECDVWVVHDSVDKRETVACAPENVILVISEEKQQVPFYDESYLSQFSTIITSRDDIHHPHVIRTFNFNPWRVRKTYDELNETHHHKTKELSIVVSNNVSTQGHLKRYAFANRLKGHFKDKLDWFGKGEREIADKWDGLFPYKYSIAMENCSVPYYFTEKIMDCYCANTMPVYWGCQNVDDFFPPHSMVAMDLNDYKKTILLIEQAMDEDFFGQYQAAITQAKDLVLNKYQFVAAISAILENIQRKPAQKISLNTREYYTPVSPGPWRKVLRKLNLNR